jgi:microcystin-dependent protein
MATGVTSWSRVAASNSNADANVNWAEGQAPSTVNNSARAQMASVAMYRDDTAGALTTGGTATAYTLTTYQGFASLAALDGVKLTFKVNVTSGADPTLAVDGLAAKDIHYSTGVAVPTGALVAGSVYTVTYSNANNEFLLHCAYDAATYLPAGMVVPYAGTTAPSGWLLCYGQAVSRTTYATLFAVTSTTYGTGDGSTTFNIPDLRGRVVAGQDDMGGSSANRLTDQTGGLNGDTLGATGGAETHTLTEAQLAAHTHTGTTASDGAHTHTIAYNLNVNQNFGTAPANQATSAGSTSTSSNGAHTHTFTTASTGDDAAHNNVQPTIILNYIIKT